MVSPRSFRAIRIASAVILIALAVREGMLGASGAGAIHVVAAVAEVALAGILVWRPRWAFWATLALTIQQMVTYGLRLSESFLGTVPLDKVSLAICLFFPTLATILYLERAEEAEKAEREA